MLLEILTTPAFSDKAPNKEASISVFFIFSELKKLKLTLV